MTEEIIPTNGTSAEDVAYAKKVKEIYIDGVNVAGCGAYKDKHCKDKTSIMFCDTNLCSNYPYCYYKQLKRLEQENEELKKENENYKLYGSSTIVAPVNHTNTEYDLLYGQSMLYKSVLEEIRDKFKLGKMVSYYDYRDIDKKINEVLG